MLAAIDLNDDLGAERDEIDDVAANWSLLTKVKAKRF